MTQLRAKLAELDSQKEALKSANLELNTRLVCVTHPTALSLYVLILLPCRVHSHPLLLPVVRCDTVRQTLQSFLTGNISADY